MMAYGAQATVLFRMDSGGSGCTGLRLGGRGSCRASDRGSAGASPSRSPKCHSFFGFQNFKKTADGGAVNAIVEPIAGVGLVAAAFFSSGGGRYIGNTNLPDLIVNQDASMTLVTMPPIRRATQKVR